MGVKDWYGDVSQLDGSQTTGHAEEALKRANGLKDVDWHDEVVEGLTIEEVVGALLSGRQEILRLQGLQAEREYEEGEAGLRDLVRAKLKASPWKGEALLGHLEEHFDVSGEKVKELLDSGEFEKRADGRWEYTGPLQYT